MTRTQRREAVTGPAAVGGAAMTPRLIQRLLNDVGDNPDQLPILQHALMRTWDYWAATEPEGEAIDLSHYEAIGGMAEALSRHADEAFNELPDDASKEIAERLFKRLTGKGEYNREMRFPTRLGELCTAIGAEETQVIAIAEVFHREGRSFLMPPPEVPLTAESLLDISHESLIRIWRRLSGWVDEEGQSARIYRRLAETSALYKERQAGLWRDPDLQIALRWRKQNRPNETWAQRYHPGFADAIRFLDKSQAAARRRKLFKILPIVLLPLVWIGFLQTKTISLEKKTISLKKKNENLKEEFGKAVDDLNESQLKTLPSTESASTPSETRGESEQAAVVSEATNEVTQGAASSVSEVRLVTCRDVRKLEPIDIGTEFEPGRIFVFARLKVTKDETLTLRWYRAGQQKSFASSKIKARNNAGHFYKNFTWKNINKEGTYEIRLYDQNRNLIRSQVFKII